MFGGFFRFLLYSLLFFFAYRLFRFFVPKGTKENKESVTKGGVKVDDVMVKDPACGIYLPKRDAIRERIKGETHYFCSEKCVENFKRGISKSVAPDTVSLKR
ncbi:MAG: hypothetical protein JW984_17010 [Deltaproteobacteria bacterium]|uniref:TRASH domain-containing protein n=1 Tax=Candidatus Zymogenus saltonus TaxID=2844893 RepID=A0A9D8KIL0_9DELT|nr:hypothetical protein [Candidatus Zymogenus saltonus]